MKQHKPATVQGTSRLHVDALNATWEPSCNFPFSEVHTATKSIIVVMVYHRSAVSRNVVRIV